MLESDSWRRLAEFRQLLIEVPAHDFEGLAQTLASGLNHLLDADLTTIMLASQEEDPQGPLGGWRLRQTLVEEEVKSLVDDFTSQELYLFDPNVQAAVVGVGRIRTLLRWDAVTPQVWDSSPTAKLLEAMGVAFSITGGVPVTAGLELFTFSMRLEGRTDFDRGHADLLEQALAGLAVPATRLALSFGLPGQKQLTPRERQCLAKLLTGRSEKQIAAELDLSPLTVHEYVVGVYRKLRVRSRGELAALWLQA